MATTTKIERLTERVQVPMTRTQHKRIERRARAANLPVAAFLRDAAEAYVPQEEEDALERLMEQVSKSTEEANQAMTMALAFVLESQERIAAMEMAHAARKAA